VTKSKGWFSSGKEAINVDGNISFTKNSIIIMSPCVIGYDVSAFPEFP
jgi:hypothetical protein